MMIDFTRDIKPISYLKAHTAEILRYVEESRTPVVVTQNGEAKAVIVDVESYQKTLNAINLAKIISLGEMDIRSGRTVSHEEAKKQFEDTFSS